VLKLKAENPGTLLMIEVGYKYRFFGEDAKVPFPLVSYSHRLLKLHSQVAARELGMVCYPDRNFVVAFVPTFRRDVYLKK
jgi:DNA mismatch repair protein MSH3